MFHFIQYSVHGKSGALCDITLYIRYFFTMIYFCDHNNIKKDAKEMSIIMYFLWKSQKWLCLTFNGASCIITGYAVVLSRNTLFLKGFILWPEGTKFPLTYLEDIDFLREVKTAVLDDLKSAPVKNTPEVSNGHLPDCRPLRRVFPRGRGHMAELVNKRDTLYFVGFIGDTRTPSELDDGIRKQIWDTDQQLVEQLQQFPIVAGYFSAERADRYNWGNLVIFQSAHAISEMVTSKTHAAAVTWVIPEE